MKFSEKQLYFLILLLLFPSLLINLGYVAFINDEAIRALVTLEMDLSGNYITPTLFGEFYYNKPPLYNWLLLIFSKIYGQSDEFISRLPTVVFLLSYGATVFYFSKKYFSTKIAFINAFALITCGRILFYDSFLGLIDICFSWVIYLLFMTVYHRWKADKMFQLFGGAYFLAALAFLMKGLPAIVFLGTTLLAHFIYQKQFKKLFSPAHFFGIGIFILLVGGYYYAYSTYNDIEIVFSTLFNESAKRTPMEHRWVDTISHLFTFHFEMIGHFLPWTFFAIYFFQKEIKSKLLKHPFIVYNLLVFVTTIPLYWVSVEVYPRYLFMHIPLIFSTLFYLYFQQEKELIWQNKLIKYLFGLAIIVTPIAVVLIPFLVENLRDVPYFYFKVATIGAFATLLAFAYFQKNNSKLLILIALLLVVRIGYNWFVLPSKEKVDRIAVVRKSAIGIGKKYNKESLFIFKNSLGLSPATGYYLMNERQKILRNKEEHFDKKTLYIFNPWQSKKHPYKKLDVLEIQYQNERRHIGKLK